MPIKVRCECGKQLTIKDETVGKRVKCPACARVFIADPAKALAPAPAPAAPAAVVPVAAMVPSEPMPANSAAEQIPELGLIEPPPTPSAPPGDAPPRRRLLWPWIAGGVVLVVTIGVVVFLLVSKAAEEDTHLRYTVSDANGFRSSRNRDSVMKTLGMSEQQLREWADDSAAADEKRNVGPVRQASGRAMTLIHQRFGETRWEGPSGKEFYTAKNQFLTLTSTNRDSVVKMLETGIPSVEQVRAWAEDESAAEENRSAIIIRAGYVEAISRGTLVLPPG